MFDNVIKDNVRISKADGCYNLSNQLSIFYLQFNKVISLSVVNRYHGRHKSASVDSVGIHERFCLKLI